MYEAQMYTSLYYNTDNCTGRWHCGSAPKDELPDPRESLANKILPVLQSKPIKRFDKMTAIHNMCQMHSNFCIFKFILDYL